MRIYRCQHCNYTTTATKDNKKKIKSAKNKMGHHYETAHKHLIPSDMTGYRWFYFLQTKKDKGSCVECKQETDFNEATMKYSRFCNNPICKQKYKETRDGRMIKKHGKMYLLDDPEFQKKMQAGRKIAGIYNWSDGKTKISYLSSYELDFLKFLDLELHWPPSDIIAPSPHTYAYEYQGKQHYYMPDYFLTSISIEVEIKDDGSALNINQDSRNKDKIKDELMRSVYTMFNYIKIVNKNYDGFLKLIEEGE
jgi:hypothetical protein